MTLTEFMALSDVDIILRIEWALRYKQAETRTVVANMKAGTLAWQTLRNTWLGMLCQQVAIRGISKQDFIAVTNYYSRHH